MQNKLCNTFSGRTGYILGFLASFGLVAFALYIQQKHNLEPCPLCISQRIIFMATGVLFLIAAIHNPQALGRRIYGALQVTGALIGMGVAARHIWIQANPDKVMAECGAGFDYIMEAFPLKKALDLIFKGTGECSAIDWTWLGLTIPQLSLIAFGGLAAYALLLAFLKKN
jgi:disulfide bond formation protein DsbB